MTDCVFGDMPEPDEKVGERVSARITGMFTGETRGPLFSDDGELVYVMLNEVVIDCRITLRDVVQTTKDGDS